MFNKKKQKKMKRRKRFNFNSKEEVLNKKRQPNEIFGSDCFGDLLYKIEDQVAENLDVNLDDKNYKTYQRNLEGRKDYQEVRSTIVRKLYNNKDLKVVDIKMELITLKDIIVSVMIMFNEQ